MERTVQKYLDILCAKEFLGELHFKRCAPVRFWQGMLWADHYGESSLQRGLRTWIARS